MIAALRRYARAFFLALGYTLRGEKPPLLQVRDRYPQLATWWLETVRLLDAIERSAEGIDAAALIVHVDKRDVSMATILGAVRFHAEREYPHLLAHDNKYGQMTLQALNLDDRYLVMRLGQVAPEKLKPVIAALGAHLDSLTSEK